ncbi:2-oxoacid:acceptor oxidoreductase family protein [Cetobacterium sp.]|uniref:2-oxoacid:acceptor oxidoreductase family protein n=1 Tax=Cetobacterium sp. TaxID=2071632 RepID=UPI003F3C05AF
MSKMVEIRWHGRGGQGAKTASLLLADVAFSSGLFVQGFPEYGPERMGAPITAYNRIGDEPIRVHSNIYEPNFVVVVDETLIKSIPVEKGLKDGGAIIVNSEKTVDDIRAELRGYSGKIFVCNARKISEECLGKNFPNTPMLGALIKISRLIPEEEFIQNMEESFKHKFASKPGVLNGNMCALKRSVDEVEG